MTMRLLTIVLLALALAGCDLGGDDTAPDTTVTIGERANPNTPEVEVDPDTAYEEEEEQAADELVEEGPDIHEDLKDESPEGDEDAATKVLETPTEGIGPPVPTGGAQNYNCPRQIVRNSSARAAGSRVEIFVLHFTVSRPGSLDAIQRLFNTPSFGASSHLGLEMSGRCEQWVDWNRKAWTQGAFNSVAESVEIIAMGNEPRSVWLRSPMFKQGILAAIVADRLRARGLQPKRVNPSGCGVQVAGWTDHNALECGNNHTDVSPNFPYDVFQQQLERAYYGAAAGPPLFDVRAYKDGKLVRRWPRTFEPGRVLLDWNISRNKPSRVTIDRVRP